MSRSTPAGSGAPAKPSSSRLCEQCGIVPLPPGAATGGAPKRFCGDCTAQRKQARERTGVKPTVCEVCHEPIEQPYSGGQKYHTECKDAARRERTKVTAPADDQMDKLFGKYEQRGDIHITDREDGTRLMILSDTQIPFVDEPLLKAVLEFANDFRPHDLILNGDIIDCVTPETKVLTYDLRWVEAGSLSVGDELVGFDEDQPGNGIDGRALPRKMRHSSVEEIGRAKQPVIALKMDDGTVLRSTPGHRWLGWKSTKNRAMSVWMRTDEIAKRVAEGRPVLLNRPTKPWTQAHDYDAGYIGAAFDGEGHITFHKNASNFAHLAFSQRPGPFLDAVEAAMDDAGWKTDRQKTPTDVQTLCLRGGMWAQAEFIGRYRMPRFIKKWVDTAPVDGYQLRGSQRGTVVGVEYEGVKEIVRIQTSSKTYLAEGFCSHNCYEISAFDTNPTRRFGLAEELAQAESLLYDLGKRMAVGGKMWFVEGNHEERLRRYLWRHAGDIASVVPDLDTLLHLDQHCAGSVPYGKAIDYLGFTVTHGNYVSQYSAYTAKRHADRYQSSGCNGHTHRLGEYSWRDGRGQSHTWYEIGCLCRMDLEYVKGIANWQSGLLIGTVMNGALHPQLIRVIETDDGRGFFAGNRYYAVD